MSIPVYDLGPGRAKRKAKRQAKRATNKAKRKAGRQAKKDAIASMPGTSSLEKRLNYKAHKHNVKKADRKTQEAAIKKAKSVTPEERKAKQNKAVADHNKRAADAIAKYGKKKTTPVKTKRGTGKTYDQAWEQSSAAYKKKYGGDKAKAIAAMKDWNKKNVDKPSAYSTSQANKK